VFHKRLGHYSMKYTESILTHSNKMSINLCALKLNDFNAPTFPELKIEIHYQFILKFN